jgi:radical SAM superfamily enzyme YgiQ (UPF0313 family)
MKIDFVIPSWHYWAEPLRAQPLTSLYLATILEKKGCDISFTDFRDGVKIPEKADLYLYTVASPDLIECQQIVQDIKKLYPNSKHIAGGPHPSILPNMTKGFDSIIVGKGEGALEQVLKDYPNIKPRYEHIVSEKSLENYPFPKRHFLNKDKIINEHLFKTDDITSTTAQFSFGCPFGCNFCANYSRGPIRRNSLQKISDEIDYLKSEYGVKGLSLQDEVCIPFNKKEAINWLNLIKSKDIKWRGQIRLRTDEDILRLAKESGLVELSFGIESVNKKVLEIAEKRININDAEKMIDMCKKYDIKTRIYLLNGLPGETMEIVQETKDFVNKTNPDLVLLSSLQPYPGSPIYNNPQKYCIKWISKDWDKFNHLVCRFKDSTDNPEDAVPYEYEKGKGLTRKQIMGNMLELQEFLRERGVNK